MRPSAPLADESTGCRVCIWVRAIMISFSTLPKQPADAGACGDSTDFSHNARATNQVVAGLKARESTRGPVARRHSDAVATHPLTGDLAAALATRGPLRPQVFSVGGSARDPGGRAWRPRVEGPRRFRV